ncbi:MAG: GNAT family N-acetyltransferase [Candidatus Zophobacter franzmannii]|nr:GNAT family N-acetyltransferase [Candidatus Zophobacter franzmannii]
MMEIKKLTKNQIGRMLGLASKAYPMVDLRTPEQFKAFEARILPDFKGTTFREWYGLFEGFQLLGSMAIYDFTVNYYGKKLKGSGIGFVAVDLLHKKQKICKEMLQWYLMHSIEKKYPLAMLYSFRPDFYKKMGFGYGTSCFSYVTDPTRFSKSDQQYQMEYLTMGDKDEVIGFYKVLYQNNHGMIPKRIDEIESMFDAPGLTVVGYREKGRLHALLYFGMKADNSTNETTHMRIEILFTNSTGLKAALSFLNSQSDQVSKIEFTTPFKHFYYNLKDIRALDGKLLCEPAFHHTFDHGMGIMYRSLNPIKLLLMKPCTLDKLRIRFLITDTFVDATESDFIITWKDGKAIRSKGKSYDLEMKMDVSDFSSWVMNAIDLATLHQYGLVELSDDSYLQTLNQAFYYHQEPICLQRF